MSRNVTQEKLIKFLYGELSFDETHALYDELDDDKEAQRDLEVMVEAKENLNQLHFNPKSETVNKILDFSASYNSLKEKV